MRRTNPIAARFTPVALLTIVAFVALSGGLAYWQILRAADLNSRANNPRVAAVAHSKDRGSILDRNGGVLAHTDPNNPGPRGYVRPSLSQVIGYSSIRFGQTGIELSMHDFLSGQKATDVIQFLWNEVLGQRTKGDNVVLTIDPKIQDAAATAMGDRIGAAVALDPRSGEILAMISNPTYNANAIDEQGEALKADPRNPLLNRATQGLYPPGSTFKTITAAAALETGAWTIDKKFTCHTAIFIEGFRIACANVPEGEGTYDFGFGYAHSINALFAQVGVDIGWGTLREYTNRFGFGSDLGMEIDVSRSTVGNGTSKVSLATTAFGQGDLLVTPLQMALVAAAVANRGVVPQPHLVLRVDDVNGKPVLTRGASERGRAMNERVASILRDLMVRNVKEAAGAPAAIPNVAVAGKTGTAETGKPEELPHAWFIGFAPADNPKVAVAVIIEHAGFGGSVAAPIAGQIMRAALGG